MTDLTSESDLRRGRLLLGGLTLGLGVLWFLAHLQRPNPPEIIRNDAEWLLFRVDVNSAEWIEFAQLDGIGSTLAQRIVADREVNGPFSSVEDLQRIRGIGPALIDRNRQWLTISGDERSETGHGR